MERWRSGSARCKWSAGVVEGDGCTIKPRWCAGLFRVDGGGGTRGCCVEVKGARQGFSACDKVVVEMEQHGWWGIWCTVILRVDRRLKEEGKDAKLPAKVREHGGEGDGHGLRWS